MSPHQQSDENIVKRRNVKIKVLHTQMDHHYGGQKYESVEFALEPKHAPVDHVFRYSEPEHSYFKVRIPPFLQLNSPDMHAKLSRESAQVQIDPKSSEIHVSSKTGDALKTVDLTLFVYGDTWMSKLLATVKVEVTPLSCIYS